MAVDLDGTNICVCSVDLHGDITYSVKQSEMTIPRKLMMTRTDPELFSFIAERVETFLKFYHSMFFSKFTYSPVISFELVFSYSVYQSAVNSDIVLRWIKGFDISDLVGQNILQTAST